MQRLPELTAIYETNARLGALFHALYCKAESDAQNSGATNAQSLYVMRHGDRGMPDREALALLDFNGPLYSTKAAVPPGLDASGNWAAPLARANPLLDTFTAA